MNWLHCFWGVGVTLSPVIISRFLGNGTGAWREGYRIVALIRFTISLVLLTQKYWIREDPVSQTETQNTAQTDTRMLLRMGGVGTSILSLGLYAARCFFWGPGVPALR